MQKRRISNDKELYTPGFHGHVELPNGCRNPSVHEQCSLVLTDGK